MRARRPARNTCLSTAADVFAHAFASIFEGRRLRPDRRLDLLVGTSAGEPQNSRSDPRDGSTPSPHAGLTLDAVRPSASHALPRQVRGRSRDELDDLPVRDRICRGTRCRRMGHEFLRRGIPLGCGHRRAFVLLYCGDVIGQGSAIGLDPRRCGDFTSSEPCSDRNNRSQLLAHAVRAEWMRCPASPPSTDIAGMTGSARSRRRAGRSSPRRHAQVGRANNSAPSRQQSEETKAHYWIRQEARSTTRLYIAPEMPGITRWSSRTLSHAPRRLEPCTAPGRHSDRQSVRRFRRLNIHLHTTATSIASSSIVSIGCGIWRQDVATVRIRLAGVLRTSSCVASGIKASSSCRSPEADVFCRLPFRVPDVRSLRGPNELGSSATRTGTPLASRHRLHG